MMMGLAAIVNINKMRELFLKAIISLIALSAPIQPAILAIGVLVTIDLIFGIIASVRSGDKFSSRKLKDTAVKLLVYNLLLIAGFVSETYMVNWIPFTKICLTFLAIIEITSIGESFQKITDKSFITFLRDSIEKYLNKGK